MLGLLQRSTFSPQTKFVSLQQNTSDGIGLNGQSMVDERLWKCLFQCLSSSLKVVQVKKILENTFKCFPSSWSKHLLMMVVHLSLIFFQGPFVLLSPYSTPLFFKFYDSLMFFVSHKLLTLSLKWSQQVEDCQYRPVLHMYNVHVYFLILT